LDIALTYSINPDGELDPLARARVDRELTTDEWKEVLKKAWEAGIPHITFTGGEPTRRDDLVELITFAEQLGQVTGVLTDGRRLADPGYVHALSQAGVDHFLIALVPEDPNSLQGLQNALASDVFTAVHLTITKDFTHKANDWLQRLQKMGLKAISFSSTDVSDDRVKIIAELRELAANLGMDLIWDIPAPYSNNNPIALEIAEAPSGAGRVWLYVEPDGDVLPGQGVNKILGSILEEPWKVLWDKAKEAQ
jgi:MoaA/NifB/PqqE/SkfB family radical SAM enzyme